MSKSILHFSAARSRSLHFGGSHATASVCSLEDSEPSSTPCSFVSLPDRVLPCPAPLLDQLSQDAMLQQIAELTQQNTLIQARLGQYQPSSAGASVSRQMGADSLSTAGTKEKPPSASTGHQPTQLVQCLQFISTDSLRSHISTYFASVLGPTVGNLMIVFCLFILRY